MSDLALIENIFASRPREDYLFKDSQIRDLPDNPNTGYANGQTTFECRNITDDTFALSQNDLIIPWSIGINGTLSAANCLGTVTIDRATAIAYDALVPGTNTYATTFLNGIPTNAATTLPMTNGVFNLGSACSVAFKSSALDLISGLNVGLANSTSAIVSDLHHLSTLNAIKLLVQSSRDWLEIFGPKLCFSKDTKATQAAGDSTSGFAKRQAYLYQMANVTYYQTAVTGANPATNTAYIAKIECASIIPLKLLHNFFANNDYPSKGIQWKLNFLFSSEFSPQAQTKAFVYSGVAPTTAPSFKICGSNGTVTAGGANYSTCIMKYRSITLPDAVQARIDEKILAGKSDHRYINYVVTDVYNDKVLQTGDLKSYQLANGIIKAIRMWIMPTANNALNSNLALNVTNMAFSSLNCKIGTTNRYVQPLISGYDMYSELSQQFQELASSPDKGSLITYDDFYPNPNLNGLVVSSSDVTGLYHIPCIDLARTQGRVQDSAISIIVDALRTPQATPSDYIVFVERMQVARFDRTRNSVAITVGSMLD